MARIQTFPTVLALVAFLAGLGLGVYLGASGGASFAMRGGSAKTQAGMSADTGLTDRGQQDAELRSHVADVERQLTDMKSKEDAAILADRIAMINKYGLSSPQAFDDSLKLTPQFSDFLKLTAGERDAVDSHLAQTFSHVKELEQQHLKLAKQDDKSVTYEVPAYPEGKALEDDLQKQIEGDVGGDRADIILNGGNRFRLDDYFLGFGTAAATIEVARTDENGRSTYRVEEHFGNGEGLGRNIEGTTLPGQLQGLFQLDPSP